MARRRATSDRDFAPPPDYFAPPPPDAPVPLPDALAPLPDAPALPPGELAPLPDDLAPLTGEQYMAVKKQQERRRYAPPVSDARVAELATLLETDPEAYYEHVAKSAPAVPHIKQPPPFAHYVNLPPLFTVWNRCS